MHKNNTILKTSKKIRYYAPTEININREKINNNKKKPNQASYHMEY
jgi:hypothetical protein